MEKYKNVAVDGIQIHLHTFAAGVKMQTIFHEYKCG